jgi:hypothetical protein
MDLKEVFEFLSSMEKINKDEALKEAEKIKKHITFIHRSETVGYAEKYRRIKCYNENLKRISKYNEDIELNSNSFHILGQNKHKDIITFNNKEISLLLNSSIPTSYVVFLCISLTIFIFSIVDVLAGFLCDFWLINIWVDLFVVLGSIGMIATIIVATLEWRNKLREKVEEKGNKTK